MAVAYTSDTDKTPATGSSFTYTSFAVSGTNPAVVVCVALDSATATVSSIACSAGLTCADGGNGANNGVLVKAQRSTGGTSVTEVEVWSLAAPAGTGTITVTLSASVPWQSNAILLSGADQTTPCPAANAGSTQGDTPSPLTVTPGSLAAADAAVGCAANAETGDAPAINQTETFNNNGTAVNAAAGYHLGTGAMTASWGSQTTNCVLVAVRVVAAAVAGRTTKNTRAFPLGVDVGMNWRS